MRDHFSGLLLIAAIFGGLALYLVVIFLVVMMVLSP
jgi:hypothetical protein